MTATILVIILLTHKEPDFSNKLKILRFYPTKKRKKQQGTVSCLLLPFTSINHNDHYNMYLQGVQNY